MGIRGELFSTRVLLQNRTYFFNVKENRVGDLYLNIVESKNKETGGFDRQSVILFADDLQEFLKGFDESLRVMEKAVREKRRGGWRQPAGTEEDKPRDRDDTPPAPVRVKIRRPAAKHAPTGDQRRASSDGKRRTAPDGERRAPSARHSPTDDQRRASPDGKRRISDGPRRAPAGSRSTKPAGKGASGQRPAGKKGPGDERKRKVVVKRSKE
jgi:hypothetical protein